jgi:threonyl-tRNA synthetase
VNEAARCGFEPYAGNFLLWLAPDQVRVITLIVDILTSIKERRA